MNFVFEKYKRKFFNSYQQQITAGQVESLTKQRAVDGCLACILGREAALHGRRLIMEQLLKENRRVKLDLAGLENY